MHGFISCIEEIKCTKHFISIEFNTMNTLFEHHCCIFNSICHIGASILSWCISIIISLSLLLWAVIFIIDLLLEIPASNVHSILLITLSDFDEIHTSNGVVYEGLLVPGKKLVVFQDVVWFMLIIWIFVHYRCIIILKFLDQYTKSRTIISK